MSGLVRRTDEERDSDLAPPPSESDGLGLREEPASLSFCLDGGLLLPGRLARFCREKECEC